MSTAPEISPQLRSRESSAVARKGKPVKWWALAGALTVALIVYEWTAWLVSGSARPAPMGPDPIPTYMIVGARALEAGSLLLFLWAVYYFIGKPWKRERRLTFDGMLIIAMTACYMLQDPWANFTSTATSFNVALINLGCPQCFAPGWINSNAVHMADPLILVGPMYGGACFLFTVIACQVMRKAKTKWPTLGTAGLIGVAFGTLFLFDLLLELPTQRFGGWAWWWAGPSWLTLWPGEYYQFPLLEAVFWGAFLASIASLRYFKDDKGHSVAERGVDQVPVSSRKKTLLQALAVIGISNVFMLVIYNIPMQFIAMHASPTPESICGKSYFTNMMAGPGTNAACPGPQIPIPRGADSATVTPEGSLHTP